jgi:hypothetical protein
MSTHSTKGVRRSAKSVRRPTSKTAGKAVKNARSAAKKADKARQPLAKSITVRKPLAQPELAAAAAMIRTASPPMQPIVTDDELPSRAHKYRVGDTVYYTSPTFGRAAATGSYTVVKLLPSEGDDHQYRIKSSGEAFERVAKESQLDRA